ncbi:MAG: RNA polymerase sigma factor [Proteobacteria bacterium]|nr:RNA polymerase sigma factor [Pseudomonadota bacterium]
MDDIAVRPLPSRDDRLLHDTVVAQAPRLRAFVRRQVADLADVEDIVQDVFAELVAATRLVQPVEHVATWLLRVARNRIVDRFRAKSRRAAATEEWPAEEPGEEPARLLDRWLAPIEDGPDAAYARSVVAEELMAALEELPAVQREAFIAHEIDGRSFRELAAETGIAVNTLLGRKHAAVLHLRKRLEAIYHEFVE